jgi:hypothetical protein
MTVSMILNCHQAGPGGPLQIVATEQDNNPVDFLDTTLVLAVTTTNVAPTPLSAAAHCSGGTASGQNDPFWDSYTETLRYGSAGGSAVTQAEQQIVTKILHLDTNFAAGRYLWFIGTADSVASGSSVPVHTSASYLIQ